MSEHAKLRKAIVEALLGCAPTASLVDAVFVAIEAQGYKLLSREPTEAMIRGLAYPANEAGAYLTAESAIRRYARCWDAAPSFGAAVKE